MKNEELELAIFRHRLSLVARLDHIVWVMEEVLRHDENSTYIDYETTKLRTEREGNRS